MKLNFLETNTRRKNHEKDICNSLRCRSALSASSPVNFIISVNSMDDTKAAKTAWANGDVIYIRFKGISKFLNITYNSATSSWTPQAYTLAVTPVATTLEVSDFSGIAEADKVLGAIHFPIAVDAKLESLLGKTYLMLRKNGDYAYTYFLSKSATAYTFDGTNVNITLSLQKPDDVALFHIDGLQANAEDYSLKIIGEGTETYPCTSWGLRENCTTGIATIGSANNAVPGIPDSDGVLFAVYLYSGFDSAKELTFTVIGPDNDYSISGTKTLTGGKQYGLPTLDSGKWMPKYKGPFTVASGQQVMFSSGNLQYQASTNTWRFAENQWDFISAANSNIASDYSGCIDLFGWGTSGYNHGAVDYQPWSTSTTHSDYNAYGSAIMSLSSSTGQADWGYLLNNRSGARINYTDNARFTLATINTDGTSVIGMIIFPDGFNVTNPDGVTWGTINSYSYWTTRCTTAGWTVLEKAGCAFLPVGGYRFGTNMYQTPTDTEPAAHYWSSNYKDADNCYYLRFNKLVYYHEYSYYRNAGMSVRLVRDL